MTKKELLEKLKLRNKNWNMYMPDGRIGWVFFIGTDFNTDQQSQLYSFQEAKVILRCYWDLESIWEKEQNEKI